MAPMHDRQRQDRMLLVRRPRRVARARAERRVRRPAPTVEVAGHTSPYGSGYQPARGPGGRRERRLVDVREHLRSVGSDAADRRRRALWSATVGGDAAAIRRPSRSRRDVDVAIVGAGYTGLWTALLARRRRPDAPVVVVDRAHGRLRRQRSQRRLVLGAAADRPHRDSPRGTAATRRSRMQRAMFDTVERGRALRRTDAGVDRFHRGGTITLAHDPYQRGATRRRRSPSCARSASATTTSPARRRRGHGALPRHGVDRRRCSRPHCAAVHPLRLVARHRRRRPPRGRAHRRRRRRCVDIEPRPRAHRRAARSGPTSSCWRPRRTRRRCRAGGATCCRCTR